MNTFLPYKDFDESAKCLDRLRLGKQRVEVLQLLRAIVGENTGWKSHPCTKMWENNVNSLVRYGVAVCDEWIRRGYNDTCRDKILVYLSENDTGDPTWLGNQEFHMSHQSNLIRKNKDYYGEYFPNISGDLKYIWPV